MSFTWIPYYKELAAKLLDYKNNRNELLKIVYGLDDEYVDFLRESKTKTEFDDIHPFAVFAIFSRLVLIGKKQTILQYFKKEFNLSADVPEDFDGIPSINPQKSFWGLEWFEDDSEMIEQNWDLFEIASADKLDEERFIKAFDLVIQQNGAKWNVSHALFRAFPDKFLSLDENSRNYLTKHEIQVMKDKDFNGKSYLELSKLIKSKIDNKELKDENFVTLSYNSWLAGNEAVNYWLIAPGDQAKMWDEFSKNNEIGIGWEDLGDLSLYKNDYEKFKNDYIETYHSDDRDYKGNAPKQIWDFYKSINIGDIVFARRGVLQIIGMGKVTSDFFYDEKRGEYCQLRKVDWEKIGEWTAPKQTSRDTVHKLKLEQAMEIIKTMNEQENEKTISLMNLLETNKNIILHGAPGTGKTFTAKDIAAQMICGKPFADITSGSEEEKIFNEHTEFVQFHPSYDYSDFVEGLRPIEGETSGDVGFERKDGVFKEFCEKALKNFLNSKKDIEVVKQEFSNKDKIDFFLSHAMAEELTFKTAKENVFIIKNYNEKHVIITYKSKDEISFGEVKLKYSDLLILLEQGKEIDRTDVKIITGRKVERQEDSYSSVLINELIKSDIKIENENSIGEESNKLENYVFIIDEINRGEMSKIFGELFYSIDPDYRGPKGKVRTQYANMLKETNDFDDALQITNSFGHFFVPENVYIIGTMNDIDRSVDSMDFAMRRRFTFVELKANECLGMINNLQLSEGISKSDILAKMTVLNNEIEKISGLSSSYHIGGSYFAKLSKYANKSKNEAFECLWNNHLKPLITDYLRGLPNMEAKLSLFKEKYDDAGNESSEEADN